MDTVALRSQFPVLERIAYLNAGTDGPLPRRAAELARAEIDRQLEDGRAGKHFPRRAELASALRAGYAGVLGADAADVALTTSTSEGLGLVLAGLSLGPDDEILTSDEEHPGLLGPLFAAQARGATVRMAPLATLHEAVRPTTTLVACSHVGWVSGSLAPAELCDVDVPVVLDGAQGVGAVPIDLAALGCVAYAGPGQKWLCGADGTGMLWLREDFADRVDAVAPSYLSFVDAGRGLDAQLRPGARRHDTPALAAEVVALSLGAIEVLAEAGWPEVQAHAIAQAATLAERLAAAGRVVAPRGASTLVAWEDPDPAATRDRLAAASVVVRDLPGTRLLRASVGAWTNDADLHALLGAL